MIQKKKKTKKTDLPNIIFLLKKIPCTTYNTDYSKKIKKQNNQTNGPIDLALNLLAFGS